MDLLHESSIDIWVYLRQQSRNVDIYGRRLIFRDFCEGGHSESGLAVLQGCNSNGNSRFSFMKQTLVFIDLPESTKLSYRPKPLQKSCCEKGITCSLVMGLLMVQLLIGAHIVRRQVVQTAPVAASVSIAPFLRSVRLTPCQRSSTPHIHRLSGVGVDGLHFEWWVYN